MGLASAGGPEEHDVLSGFDEVERAEMRDDVAFEGALVVEVELLERLAGRIMRATSNYTTPRDTALEGDSTRGGLLYLAAKAIIGRYTYRRADPHVLRQLGERTI